MHSSIHRVPSLHIHDVDQALASYVETVPTPHVELLPGVWSQLYTYADLLTTLLKHCSGSTLDAMSRVNRRLRALTTKLYSLWVTRIYKERVLVLCRERVRAWAAKRRREGVTTTEEALYGLDALAYIKTGVGEVTLQRDKALSGILQRFWMQTPPRPVLLAIWSIVVEEGDTAMVCILGDATIVLDAVIEDKLVDPHELLYKTIKARPHYLQHLARYLCKYLKEPPIGSTIVDRIVGYNLEGEEVYESDYVAVSHTILYLRIPNGTYYKLTYLDPFMIVG